MKKHRLAKEILDLLLSKEHLFVDDNEIYWGWREGVSLETVDKELAKKIHKYLEV